MDLLFFVKQKTAYEMRISDWSSDVCSSDLPRTYGALVGRLLVPSFFISAAAPLAYAVVIERFGDGAALMMSLVIALIVVAAGLVLHRRFGPARYGV